MFDIGFSELMVIGVVALIVIGPERMPKVARTAGALMGRAQRYLDTLKAEIESEADLEDLKRIKSTFSDAAKSVGQSVSQAEEALATTLEPLGESFAQQVSRPAAAAVVTPAAARVELLTANPVESPDVPAQLDLWPESPTVVSRT